MVSLSVMLVHNIAEMPSYQLRLHLRPILLAVSRNCQYKLFEQSIHPLGKDIKSRNKESIKSFMIGNKTDWSMRVFSSNQKIKYPRYILKAIGVGDESRVGSDE